MISFVLVQASRPGVGAAAELAAVVDDEVDAVRVEEVVGPFDLVVEVEVPDEGALSRLVTALQRLPAVGLTVTLPTIPEADPERPAWRRPRAGGSRMDRPLLDVNLD